MAIEMKFITMLRTRPGSPNGLDVHRYEEGVTYEVPVDLAEAFRRAGHAVIREVTPPPEPEPKVAVAAALAPEIAPSADAHGVAAARKGKAKSPEAAKPGDLSGSKDKSLSAAKE